MDYTAALKATPAPGDGCHPYLMRIANLGVRAGLQPEQVAADIRAAIPAGRRKVPDREILVTVQKAFRERADNRWLAGWKPHNGVKRPSIDADGLRRRIIAEDRRMKEICGNRLRGVWMAHPKMTRFCY